MARVLSRATNRRASTTQRSSGNGRALLVPSAALVALLVASVWTGTPTCTDELQTAVHRGLRYGNIGVALVGLLAAIRYATSGARLRRWCVTFATNVALFVVAQAHFGLACAA